MGGERVFFSLEFCFQSQATGCARCLIEVNPDLRDVVERVKESLSFQPCYRFYSIDSFILPCHPSFGITDVLIFSYPAPSLDDPELGRKWEGTTREA